MGRRNRKHPHTSRYPDDGLDRRFGYKRETVPNEVAPYSAGFSINETWGALRRCWLAYKIAARSPHGNQDYNKAVLYAKRIRKLQFELGITISEFPEFDINGTDPDDVDLICN